MELSNVRCVLLDIEGTTTSISFVKDILFPYVKTNIRSFIQDHWREPVFRDVIDALKNQSEIDVNEGLEGAVLIPPAPGRPTAEELDTFHNTIVNNVLWQMSSDRKTTALKLLQGHMWATYYLNKEIFGHVYDDVSVALKNWKKASKKIYIYSSGSVEAQKLLFGNSIHGNLMEYLDGYFDTKVGPKTDASSYKKIAEAIGLDSQSVLFLTDVCKEAYAAQEAGMKTLLVMREGNTPLSDKDMQVFKHVVSFSEVIL